MDRKGWLESLSSILKPLRVGDFTNLECLVEVKPFQIHFTTMAWHDDGDAVVR